jgi:3-hydroxyacyl-CoA dehydrogenase
MKKLIPEPIKPHCDRKGGAVNLMLSALMLESAGMVEEGHDAAAVEQAGKAAFGAEQGFLSWMDEIGLVNAVKFLFHLSLRDQGEGGLFHKYNNFFSPPEILKKRLAETGAAGEKGVKWITPEESQKTPSDALTINVLIKRLQAVSFMVAVELAEAGLLTVKEVEKSCKQAFQWKEGPFGLMNQTGIPETLNMVTEKMELSHRREINFPVPQMLIDQVHENKFWNLEEEE